jgi:hypothetical protein
MVEENKQYQRVGGWLAFFIFGLIVLLPIRTFIDLDQAFEQLGQTTTSDAVLAAGIFDIAVSVAIMCFGIYAGLRLLWLKPNAVRLAKRYLISLFLYTVLMTVLVILVGIANPHSEIVSTGLLPQLGGIIYAIFWYFYLEKSERVAGTYRA